MKNFVQTGDHAVITGPSGGLLSGDFAMIGALFGVAQVDIAEGATGAIVRKGVFELTKATGAAWTQGDQLYWDAGAKKFTKTAAGNTPCGIALADALSGDTTGIVSIDPSLPLEVNGVIGAGAGYKIARGSAAALDGSNPTPIATGLATIAFAGAQLRGTSAPGDNTSVLTVDYTGSDGTLNVYAWKNTGGSDPTLVASTGVETFDWFAIGT